MHTRGKQARSFYLLKSPGARELEVELEEEYLGEGEGEHVEAGGLDDEVTPLQQIEDHLDVEEAAPRHLHQELRDARLGTALHLDRLGRDVVPYGRAPCDPNQRGCLA